MTAEARNLEAICAAIKSHDASCDSPATGVAMCAFEAERLGWDSIMGLPIVEDDSLGTGSFRVLCDREDPSIEGALADEREGVPA